MALREFTIELDVDDLRWIVEHMTKLSREQILTVGEPWLLSEDTEGDPGIVDLIRAVIWRAWDVGAPLSPGKLPELRAAIEQQLSAAGERMV